ncbi:hypothetical protein [Burkholderia ubonensis]|uniref:hypothetical protein n=1 Tax=Burkholderia ubonensis TaxID=101571 RepID=UPI000A576DFE|nr:hypothetical protein [Burkholderia ubonensis]
MSFFTILGAATGDLFSGMMADRMREPAKPDEEEKPERAETEGRQSARPATPQASPQVPAPLKSYRTSMGDRAYY